MEVKNDWEKRILRLDPGAYPKPEPLVLRGSVPVVQRGELTVISGPKKSLKTHLHQVLITLACGINKIFHTNSNELKLLTIDTEQNPGLLADQYNHLMDEAGRPMGQLPDNVKTIWEIGESPEQILADTMSAVRELRPDILVLDGIADMVHDVNDYAESLRLVRKLQKMALDYKMAIVIVIHQNPGTKKERGHLGTILANKTTGYISLSRQGKNVKVSCADGCRGEPFPDFYIRYCRETQTIVEDSPSGGEAKPAPMSLRRVAPTNKKGSPRRSVSETESRAQNIPSLFKPGERSVAESEMAHRIITKYGIPDHNRTQAYRAINLAMRRGIIVVVGMNPKTIAINDN